MNLTEEQIIKITEEERILLSKFIGEKYIGNEIDFNKLMIFVEKIESINLGNLVLGEYIPGCETTYNNANVVFRIEHTSVFIDMYADANVWDNWMRIEFSPTKKEAVYNAVLKFIEWYNTNKK